MSHPPPIPPGNRSDKGSGEGDHAQADQAAAPKAPDNAEQQGRQGNVKQNTTNPGYQQDR